MCQLTVVRLKCGCPYYPSLDLLDPCPINCGKQIGVALTRFSDTHCGLHSLRPYDPRSIEAFERVENKVPRFLFRGFHGANMATIRGYNTQTGVYPFAYPPRQNTARQTRTGYEAEVGVPPTGRPQDEPLISMTFWNHIEMSRYHVEFDLRAPAKTPYTSWTADFTTALWWVPLFCLS